MTESKYLVLTIICIVEKGKTDEYKILLCLVKNNFKKSISQKLFLPVVFKVHFSPHLVHFQRLKCQLHDK